MKNKPVILFVSPRLPQPLNTGTNIRIRNLLNALCDVGDVDWVGYASHSEIEAIRASEDSDPWWKRCRSFRVAPWPDWPALEGPRYRAMLRGNPFAQRPILFTSFPSEPLQSMIAASVADADIVWAERLSTAETLLLPLQKTIVDLDDLEAVKLGRQADQDRSMLTRWVMQKESRRLQACEGSSAGRYAAVCVCSTGDRGSLFKRKAF